MHVVVLGGYGNFGARICRALARNPQIEVTAAARNPEDGARRARLDSCIRSARLDLSASDFAVALRRLSPSIVVHCAGPFQGQDYRVAQASIAAGAHYVDLADGRAFVARFAEQLDAAASSAGVLAVSGASTLPALSSAVVDALLGRFRELHEIRTIIAPAQRTPRGAATLAGVLSYAGRPFRWLSAGRWVEAHGWQEIARLHMGGLRDRWAAACDVPDLELFPARYPSVRTVEFRAALELRIEHAALWAAGGLRRAGLPLPLERWAGLLERAASLLNVFGSERGGMQVSLTGVRHDGRHSRIDWTVLANGNHGPEIPCMAAVLTTNKIASGALSVRGALPCMGLVALHEYAPEFERWAMTTAIEETPA